MTSDNGYSYSINALIAVDQGLNALIGGSCDETLSSRAYRKSRISGGGWRLFERAVNALFWLDRGSLGQRHCELAYMVEMQRGHMPKAMALGAIKIK
jgi:hypothetical protein